RVRSAPAVDRTADAIGPDRGAWLIRSTSPTDRDVVPIPSVSCERRAEPARDGRFYRAGGRLDELAEFAELPQDGRGVYTQLGCQLVDPLLFWHTGHLPSGLRPQNSTAMYARVSGMARRRTTIRRNSRVKPHHRKP